MKRDVEDIPQKGAIDWRSVRSGLVVAAVVALVGLGIRLVSTADSDVVLAVGLVLLAALAGYCGYFLSRRVHGLTEQVGKATTLNRLPLTANVQRLAYDVAQMKATQLLDRAEVEDDVLRGNAEAMIVGAEVCGWVVTFDDKRRMRMLRFSPPPWLDINIVLCLPTPFFRESLDDIARTLVGHGVPLTEETVPAESVETARGTGPRGSGAVQ